ncbi:hypothetical protein MJM95_31445, partial [Salmonella enterica subsp. enterica serovar Anatum]|nr:hypothetical protein [Salmonella enterica subsp. enterica serovar Anatum]
SGILPEHCRAAIWIEANVKGDLDALRAASRTFADKLATFEVKQVVEPIGEARPSWQIWKELGEQLGLGQYYPWQDMQTRQLYQ